ncbi:MAG TPA: TetR/AcrR family transcriptional regulator [Anaerolineales bacterium]|nr:TetR/AcrR family transcriptional regulator [Anaerolineales bacterium]
MSFDKSFEHDRKLFHAAIDEFAAAGYEQASLNAILKNAGMSKGQFYYHFKGKQDLYFALIAALIERKRAFMERTIPSEGDDGSFFEILETQLRHGLAFATQHPEIQAFSESFLKEKGSPIFEAALERFNFREDAALDRLVAAAWENGEFREDLPFEFVRKTIGYLFNHVTDFTELRGLSNADKSLRQLLIFMKHGLSR